MEPERPIEAPLKNENNKNKQNIFKITTIVAAAIAACGIGFGVYGIIQSSQKDTQISDLKSQNSQKDAQISNLENKISSLNQSTNKTPENNATGNETSTTQTGNSPYIENNYFYVPDWGLKFKIPEDLANYGYAVNYNSARTGYETNGPTIGFTAMLKSDEHGAQAAYYDDIETCTITSVQRYKGHYPENGRINGIIKDIGNDDLLIWNRLSTCEYNLHLDEIQEKIQAMFQNPEAI